jgi:hypothetical protein
MESCSGETRHEAYYHSDKDEAYQHVKTHRKGHLLTSLLARKAFLYVPTATSYEVNARKAH